MFDYTLIKNKKTTELGETNWSCPVVSVGILCNEMRGTKDKEA